MSFEVSGPNLIIKDGSREAFNTSTPMMILNPLSAIELSSYSVEFPDFWKGVIYVQTRNSVPGPPFPRDEHGCWTMTSPIVQEWGPGEAAPNNLADAALGTVPAGTQYLEVWVNMSRTVIPANWLDIEFSSSFPEGQWVKLEGGSCLVEQAPFCRRLFEIVLDGTSVVLRRYQSVQSGGWSRANPGASNGNETFFYPGTNAPSGTGMINANFGALIDQKFGGGATHRPSGKEAGSSNNVPCSMDLTGKSFASTWTGSIRIIPGRMST